MKNLVTLILAYIFLTFPSGCARLYHVQVGEIDNTNAQEMTKFDIKVSETGVDFQQAAEVSKMFMSKKQKATTSKIQDIVGLFYMGPKTGNMVFSEDYADTVVKMLMKNCPTKRVTGLTIIREARDYPIISGEIIKISGYCINGKRSNSGKGGFEDEE